VVKGPVWGVWDADELVGLVSRLSILGLSAVSMRR
jgi:hypothetical protein